MGKDDVIQGVTLNKESEVSSLVWISSFFFHVNFHVLDPTVERAHFMAYIEGSPSLVLGVLYDPHLSEFIMT